MYQVRNSLQCSKCFCLHLLNYQIHRKHLEEKNNVANFSCSRGQLYYILSRSKINNLEVRILHILCYCCFRLEKRLFIQKLYNKRILKDYANFFFINLWIRFYRKQTKVISAIKILIKGHSKFISSLT